MVQNAIRICLQALRFFGGFFFSSHSVKREGAGEMSHSAQDANWRAQSIFRWPLLWAIQSNQLVDRLGPTQNKALYQGATTLAQECQLGVGFHTFGDDVQIHIAAKL